MIEMNYFSLVVAAVAAFIASFVWYMIFGTERAKLSGISPERPKPTIIFGELLKNIVLGLVVSYLATQLGVVAFMPALSLALIFWVGFPVLILISSVMYEKVPFRLAAIHAGDWLLKLVLVTEIVSLWR